MGGELSYYYGLRVNRNVFESAGLDEFVPVLGEDELSDSEMRQLHVHGARILLSRAQDGRICAISDVYNPFGGPLGEGNREGDTVVCPWHKSRFDPCTGEALSDPATFPQPGYESGVRDGKIEIKAAEDNAQKRYVRSWSASHRFLGYRLK